MKAFEKAVSDCKTRNQVMKALEKYGKRIMKDDSDEVGCFSIWLDNTTRIYKGIGRSTMTLQKWHKVNMEYSGIPVYFG